MLSARQARDEDREAARIFAGLMKKAHKEAVKSSKKGPGKRISHTHTSCPRVAPSPCAECVFARARALGGGDENDRHVLVTIT